MPCKSGFDESPLALLCTSAEVRHRWFGLGLVRVRNLAVSMVLDEEMLLAESHGRTDDQDVPAQSIRAI